jgi:hypothetical protein
MVYSQTQNPNLGKIWKALEWKMLRFMTLWNIFSLNWYNLKPFGIFCGHLLFFSRFGMFGKKNLATLHTSKNVFFQLQIFFLFFSTLSAGVAVVAFAFTAYTPRHRCRIPNCEDADSAFYNDPSTGLPPDFVQAAVGTLKNGKQTIGTRAGGFLSPVLKNNKFRRSFKFCLSWAV